MSSPHKNPDNSYFSAIVRDLTPASARHAAQVLYAPVSKDPEVTRYCGTLLPESELHRAERFANYDDKICFIQRRAFRRFCGSLALGSSPPLSQVIFAKTKNGRPYLPIVADTWFSFSSCRSGFLGAWSSTHAIGVDLEERTSRVDPVELAKEYFSPAEARLIEMSTGSDRQRAFVQLWSLKEAALKSIGEGLPLGLDAFCFELAPKPRVIHAPHRFCGWQDFDTYTIEGTDACSVLVTRELV